MAGSRYCTTERPRQIWRGRCSAADAADVAVDVAWQMWPWDMLCSRCSTADAADAARQMRCGRCGRCGRERCTADVPKVYAARQIRHGRGGVADAVRQVWQVRRGKLRPSRSRRCGRRGRRHTADAADAAWQMRHSRCSAADVVVVDAVQQMQRSRCGTADAVQQMRHGRCSAADVVVADAAQQMWSWQVQHGRCCAADVAQQMRRNAARQMWRGKCGAADRHGMADVVRHTRTPRCRSRLTRRHRPHAAMPPAVQHKPNYESNIVFIAGQQLSSHGSSWLRFRGRQFQYPVCCCPMPRPMPRCGQRKWWCEAQATSKCGHSRRAHGRRTHGT